jgi:hypothetical protein
VDWSHIVKGYEYKKGDFVALADADFKHANVKASETIEIDTFCDVAQIPAMYYEKPYYLAPGKGGDKVYTLLRQALESTDKVAVATLVMHQRQHLCAITPRAVVDAAHASIRRRDPAGYGASGDGQDQLGGACHGEATRPEHGREFHHKQIQGYLPSRSQAAHSRENSK